MTLKGKITYKQIIFNYELINHIQGIIYTEEPTKISILRGVRKKINRILAKKTGSVKEIIFDFTLIRNLPNESDLPEKKLKK